MIDLGIPLYNQLSSVDDDDPYNKSDNCGETCCKMVGAWFGITEGDEEIKIDFGYPANFQGYSYVSDLSQWLSFRGISNVISQPEDVAATIVAFLQQGQPSIYLRYWNLTNLTGGHFVVANGLDDSGNVQLNNPWNGVKDYWQPQEINDNSSGHYLVVITEPKLNPYQIEAEKNYSLLGIPMNPDTALSKAYVRKYAAYVASGYDAVLNPGPAIQPEWSGGGDAYLYLDSGEILHWSSKTGMSYVAEYAQHSAILTKCGWT